MAVPQAEALQKLYGGTRAKGLNGEVKRRILMGTHALSAGYFDAYYKRAQQVRSCTTSVNLLGPQGCTSTGCRLQLSSFEAGLCSQRPVFRLLVESWLAPIACKTAAVVP